MSVQWILDRIWIGSLMIGNEYKYCIFPLWEFLVLFDEFTFSKDILNPSSPHFGYFTRPNYFGMVTPENQLVYNLDANTVQLDEGTEKGANLEKGKAFLQKLYDDLAKR